MILTGFTYWGDFGLSVGDKVIAISPKYSNFTKNKVYTLEKAPSELAVSEITEVILKDNDKAVFACPYEHTFVLACEATKILYGIK